MDDEQIRPFVTEHHLEEFSTYLEEYGRVGGAIPLLKLHGDIASPATLVANIEQTRAGLSLARDNALGALIQRMEGQSVRPWWYVGYSMRDRDLSNTWNSSRVANFLEYWISPFMDPTVRRFIQEHRLRTWETAGLGVDVPRRHISLIARDFYELMEADLTSQWANPDRL
jgi:hypothetical protein